MPQPSESLPSPTRRIFVGDVQGCHDELCDLLDKTAFSEHSDGLYLVGDLINRGPASAEVLRTARALGATCVLGNHEAKLIERGLFDAAATADDFPTCADLVTADDREELGTWVATWPWILELDDVLMVHAAVPPSLWSAVRWSQPSDRERGFALSTRYCDAHGTRPHLDWPPPAPPFVPWHTFYDGTWTVVYGHWARQGLSVQPKLRGLDSGCVYGRALTAWIAEEDRIVQVEARRRYS